MKALRTIGAVLLLSTAAGGVTAANSAGEYDARSPADPAITHTVLYHPESVLGKEVFVAGRNAGRIVDILTDASGHVSAAVIDYGGFLGLGSRKIAVAWSDLHFDPGPSGVVTMDISAERLKRAPEVKTGQPVVVISGNDPEPEPDVTRN